MPAKMPRVLKKGLKHAGDVALCLSQAQPTRPITTLCADCQTSVVFDDLMYSTSKPWGPPWDHPHHVRSDVMPDLQGLRSGADSGCGLCLLLREAVLGPHGKDPTWASCSGKILLSFYYVESANDGGHVDQLKVYCKPPHLPEVLAISFHISTIDGENKTFHFSGNVLTRTSVPDRTHGSVSRNHTGYDGSGSAFPSKCWSYAPMASQKPFDPTSGAISAFTSPGPVPGTRHPPGRTAVRTGRAAFPNYGAH